MHKELRAYLLESEDTIRYANSVGQAHRGLTLDQRLLVVKINHERRLAQAVEKLIEEIQHDRT